MPVNNITHGNFMRGLPNAGGFRGQRASANAILAQQDPRINAILSNAARFVHNAVPQANRLHSTLSNLQSVIDGISAVPSDASVLRVREFGGGTVPEISVEVQQAATTQRNEGTALSANARAVPPGDFRFEIEIDGTRRVIAFSTNTHLTNREFQQQMATAINTANVGVNASVSTIAGSSSLRLETATTGAAENDGTRFTIRDLSGNAVERTGVDNIVQQARDAVFSVDGEERVSATNDIDLGGGLEITLLAASEEAVTFSPGHNAAGIRNAVRDIARQFNSLLETARENSIDNRTRSLARELESVARRNRRQLSDIGISINENGLLAIDEDALNYAIENGTAERVLGETRGLQNPFTNALTRITNNIRTNPTRHINSGTARLPGFGAMLQAAANNNTLANEPPPSPFDARTLNDMLGNLLNTLR